MMADHMGRLFTGRGMLLAVFLVGAVLANGAIAADADGRADRKAQAATDATAQLHAWLDDQYEQELRFSPQQLTLLGRRELYDQLDDRSVGALDREIAWYENSVAAMRVQFAYDDLDDEGRTSYDFWAYRLQELKDYRQHLINHFPISQLDGPHVDLPQFMINYHRVDTLDDMRAYIARVGQIGRSLGQTMSRVREAADAGVRPPRFAQEMVIEQLQSMVSGAPFEDGADSPLWADAKTKLTGLREAALIDATLERALLEQSRAVLVDSMAPAYREALDWFRSSLAKTDPGTPGAGSLPDGKAYYAAQLRQFTTTDLSAAEIHALGLQEVARIQKQMRRIMGDVGFPGDLRAFFEFVRRDERFYYPDTQAGRQRFMDDTHRYLERVNTKLPEYFGILPKAPLEVRRVEAFRELDGAAAFYEQGTADGSRPGVYYMHLSDMRANNLTDLQTTAYHEGNPGHHMQVSIAQEREDLPLFRANVWHSGYGEGWALYAEQLAWEMGVYDDPYYDFGRLTAEIFRAIRLVVDTGIHALGWSEEAAVQYMLENSAIPETTVRSEVRRYIVWPGQATSYKIGMLALLELRSYARAMLGDDFDIRHFHDRVLGGGSLPLSILERRVRDWVAEEQDYRAVLRRGSYGVAHINAEDYGSLGYGEAYAAAEDHVCNIAWSLLQARGELARYLGPGVSQRGIATDALVRALDIRGQAERAFAAQSPMLQRWLAGYAAGYNRYLREFPGASDSTWCHGADWLQPMSPIDIMARMVLLAQTTPRMSSAVAAAQPPGSEAGATPYSDRELIAALEEATLPTLGSNAWAIGRDLSENGRGLLLGNPHYPWYGSNRFWEKHLTIPGKLDVYGAHLLGAPGVAIGFNKAVGWSHTVSASQRLVLYRLRLVEGDPTRYHYGGETRPIEERAVSVPVLQPDGSIGVRRQSIWFSHYGPLLSLPNAGWTAQYAYTARDANANNHALVAQWQAMDAADSMDAFIETHRRYNAMPWVNTIAVSHDGRAVYLDNSTVGNLSSEAQALWRASLHADPLAAGLYAQRGLVLVDGSDPRFEWVDDGSSPVPGTVPFERRPFLERQDYIFNANDSYWLSSPRRPLKGYSILYGDIDSARSLRTRMNIRLLENRYGDAGEDQRFNRREIQQALFSNRSLAAELLLPELVQSCLASGDANLESACRVLAAYNGRLDLQSPGALLFREWLTRYDYNQTLTAGSLFREDFDPARAENTPAGLADRERALDELRGAMAVLEAAGLALDASLEDAQFAWRSGRAIAIHGGNRREGVANLQISGNPAGSAGAALPPSGISGVTPQRVADSRYLTDAGYPVVHGSSFVLTLSYDDAGPIAETLLSYSQSGDPGSEHFSDQTSSLYAEKRWKPVAFNSDEVEADTQALRVLSSRD